MGQEPQLQPQEDLPRFFCFIRCITMAAITAASITIAIMFPMFSLIQLNMVKFLLLTYYIIFSLRLCAQLRSFLIGLEQHVYHACEEDCGGNHA